MWLVLQSVGSQSPLHENSQDLHLNECIDELRERRRWNSQDDVPVEHTTFELGHRIGNVVGVNQDTVAGDGVLGVEMALESGCGCVGSTNFRKDPMLFHLQECSIDWAVPDLRTKNLLDKRRRRLSLDVIDVPSSRR